MAQRRPPQDPRALARLNTMPTRSGSTMSHLLVAVDEQEETGAGNPPALGAPSQTFKLPPPITLWQEEAPSCWDGDEDDELWRADLRWDGNNHIRHFQTNVEIILEKSLEYRGALAYDEFTNRVVILRPLPGGGRPGDHFTKRHVLAFRAYCEVQGLAGAQEDERRAGELTFIKQLRILKQAGKFLGESPGVSALFGPSFTKDLDGIGVQVVQGGVGADPPPPVKSGPISSKICWSWCGFMSVSSSP